MGTFEVNSGIKSIYEEYLPALDNLYIVELYQPNPNSKLGDFNEDYVNNYIRLHAVDVNFPEETLNLSRHPISKKFHLNDSNPFTRQDSLTITWRENEAWEVKKYHEAWVGAFYNKEKDCFISQKDDDVAYRNIKITLPASKGENYIIFHNVLPHNTGNLNLKWGNNPNIISHTMTYYPERYGWGKNE